MSDVLLNFLPEAKQDLQDIWSYTIDNWGEVQADDYINSIKKSCYELNQMPLLGRSVPDAGKGVRVYRCQSHYIFYLKNSKGIIFLAFIHEKQDMLQAILTRLP